MTDIVPFSSRMEQVEDRKHRTTVTELLVNEVYKTDQNY